MNRARAASAEEPGILGIRLDRWPVASVVPGSSAAEAGLRDGDILVTVDGTDTSSAEILPEQLKLLQGPAGAVSEFTVRRAGQTLTVAIKRASAAAARTHGQELEPGILLIKIPTFEGSGIAEKVKSSVESQKTVDRATVIIDLRDNGGGRPEEANAVADLFLSDRLLQVCEFRDGTRIAFKSHPGEMDRRVILLTNKQTGSAAEMLVMALRDNSRATAVGEATAGVLFGKDTAELVGGETILFRVAPTVLSPTGRDYSLTGIPPDVAVLATIDDDPDNTLSRALEIARLKR
jgi:carboxyl-terminal processing protease